MPSLRTSSYASRRAGWSTLAMLMKLDGSKNPDGTLNDESWRNALLMAHTHEECCKLRKRGGNVRGQVRE